MSNSLSNLAINTPVVIEEEDVIRKGYIKESGVYEAVIKMVYVLPNPATIGFALEFDLGAAEGTYKENVYISRKRQLDANGVAIGEPEFTFQRNGSSVPMMGYTVMNALTQAAVGQKLDQLTTEPKTVNVYNKDAKKDLPQTMEVVTSLIGKKVIIGLMQEYVDKNKQVGDKWIPSGEARLSNRIVRVFNSAGLTVTEVANGVVTPTFMPKWVEHVKGYIKDCTKSKKGKAMLDNPTTAGSPSGESVFGSGVPSAAVATVAAPVQAAVVATAPIQQEPVATPVQAAVPAIEDTLDEPAEVSPSPFG